VRLLAIYILVKLSTFRLPSYFATSPTKEWGGYHPI